MTDDRPTCFVAMPITTPGSQVAAFSGDTEHFNHVLEHLFAPAVEQAKYQLIRPIMKGADLIHAEIIRNLEEADLVLCDISLHNPNVFFELGIRTALDRPVALVRDSFTDRLPFDTGILNTHTYDGSLAVWRLQQEVDELTNHLLVSAERAAGGNPLWKYFGLTRRAAARPATDDPVSAKLDVLLAAMRGVTASAPAQPLTDGEDGFRQERPVKQMQRQRPLQSWEGRDTSTALPNDKNPGQLPDGLAPDVEALLLDLSAIAGGINARVWLESIEGDHIALDARPFRITSRQWSDMVKRAAEAEHTLSLLEGTLTWDSRTEAV